MHEQFFLKNVSFFKIPKPIKVELGTPPYIPRVIFSQFHIIPPRNTITLYTSV